MKRSFRRFIYKEAVYRINPEIYPAAAAYIPGLWDILEKHIRAYPDFRDSLRPLEQPESCPDIAEAMYAASTLLDVGPMAAVAGTFSEYTAKACISSAKEAIVENGGDNYLILEKDMVMGIYAGNSELNGNIGLLIKPEDTPLAVCSSSGTMGHSLSLGSCDIATVFSGEGALADCAATAAANMVKKEADIQAALDKICAVEGIRGVLIIKGGKIGLSGKVPEIIRVQPEDVKNNLTIHPGYTDPDTHGNRPKTK